MEISVKGKLHQLFQTEPLVGSQLSVSEFRTGKDTVNLFISMHIKVGD